MDPDSSCAPTPATPPDSADAKADPGPRTPKKPKRRGGFGCLIPVLIVAVIAFAGRDILPGFGGRPSDLGGGFSLVNSRGETVTNRDFLGHYALVYFGYTYCPDICPTSLSAMARALELMDPKQAARITPVFVSVDPDRDTPEVIGPYVAAFHPRLVGLTGTAEDIAKAAAAYKVKYKTVAPEGDGPYLIDHSAIVYFMGPQGQFLTHFTHGTAPERMAEMMGRFIAALDKAAQRAAEKAGTAAPPPAAPAAPLSGLASPTPAPAGPDTEVPAGEAPAGDVAPEEAAAADAAASPGPATDTPATVAPAAAEEADPTDPAPSDRPIPAPEPAAPEPAASGPAE